MGTLNEERYKEWIDIQLSNALHPLPNHRIRPTGCWYPIKGDIGISIGRDGYAKLGWNYGRNWNLSIHTLSLIYAHYHSDIWREIKAIKRQGKQPMGLHSLLCGNWDGAGRACFNPAHIRLGDAEENYTDREAHLRQLKTLHYGQLGFPRKTYPNRSADLLPICGTRLTVFWGQKYLDGRHQLETHDKLRGLPCVCPGAFKSVCVIGTQYA